MFARQGELAQGLGLGGGLGDADLVPEVGQGGDVVLAGRLGLLAGGPALDLGQRDVGGRALAGLEPTLERAQEAVVEVGQLLGDPELLPAIGGGLEEAVGLHQRGQLGLDDLPLDLLVGGLGDPVAVGGLVAPLDRLAEGDQEIVLAVVVERARRAAVAVPVPVPVPAPVPVSRRSRWGSG